MGNSLSVPHFFSEVPNRVGPVRTEIMTSRAARPALNTPSPSAAIRRRGRSHRHVPRHADFSAGTTSLALPRKSPIPDRLQGDRAETGLRMTALRRVRRTEQKESPQSPKDSGDMNSVGQLILSTLTFDVTLPMTLSGLSDLSVLTSRHLSELSQETRSDPSSALLKRLRSSSPPASIK